MPIKVLFVCLGNICRSPTAHGIFEQQVADKHLSELIIVDSAGTGDWHLGHSPDERSAKAALARGYDLSKLSARLVTKEDFKHFDYILAMDKTNLSNLKAMSPSAYHGELKLFLSYGDKTVMKNLPEEVPDPYTGGTEGFEYVLDLVEHTSAALLRHIVEKHQL